MGISNEVSGPVGVLAVLDSAVESIEFDHGVNGCKELREARAAVAELIEAMRSAEALAHCCMAIDGYSRMEIADMARASVTSYRAALARVGGAK